MTLIIIKVIKRREREITIAAITNGIILKNVTMTRENETRFIIEMRN